MSTEDRDDQDLLQSLIAEILEAENLGETVDERDLPINTLITPNHYATSYGASRVERMTRSGQVQRPNYPSSAGEPERLRFVIWPETHDAKSRHGAQIP